jgi:tetratricopeptide (TPR) repeat protein
MTLYDAFVSYSHAKDKPIAAALQSAIQRLGKPWYRRRALRVFRDDTSLSATPHLWPTIENALAASRFFLVLASPEAAASRWVNKEITYWLDHNSIDTLLIGVTDGELTWNDPIGDFDARANTPLPPVLAGRFPSEPKWVDLRAYRNHPGKADAKFTELAADFAAAIRGMPKEDLLSQEVRQQRRALTLAWSAAAALLALTIGAGWSWYDAVQQKKEAVAQKQEADIQRMHAEHYLKESVRELMRAEKNLEAGIQAANSLVLDFSNNFRDRVGIPADVVVEILNRARNLQQQLAERVQSLPLLESEFFALQVFTKTMLTLQRTDEAATAAERSVEIMLQLAEKEPKNKLVKRNLAISYDTLAGVYSDKRLFAQAREQIEKSIAILEELVAAHPDDLDLHRDLANRYSHLGDMLIAAGDYSAALDHHQLALAIIAEKSLASADELYLFYFKVGEAFARLSKYDQALELYRKVLSTLESLSAKHKDNSRTQRHLGAAFQHIGNVLFSLERHQESLEHHRRAAAVAERLAAFDEGNPVLQSDLYSAYTGIGDALDALGMKAQAQDAYKKCLVIAERFAVERPTEIDWQIRTVWSLLRLAASQPDQSVGHLTRALDIIRRLDAIGLLPADERHWVNTIEQRLEAVKRAE